MENYKSPRIAIVADGDQQEDQGDDVEEHPDEGRQSGDVLREPSDES